MAEGRSANAHLVRLLRSWISLVALDPPGFDGASILEKADVPDDVQTNASRLINTILDYQETSGETLPYMEALTRQLNAAIAVAAKEAREA